MQPSLDLTAERAPDAHIAELETLHAHYTAVAATYKDRAPRCHEMYVNRAAAIAWALREIDSLHASDLPNVELVV